MYFRLFWAFIQNRLLCSNILEKFCINSRLKGLIGRWKVTSLSPNEFLSETHVFVS